MYASQSDLAGVGLNPNMMGALANNTAAINGALQDASDLADSSFQARYGAGSTPLLAWDTTVTKNTAMVAAYYIICMRGFNPNASADQMFRKNYEDAVAFFGRVQRQQAHPRVTPGGSGSANPGAGQPILISSSVVDLNSGATAPNRGY